MAEKYIINMPLKTTPDDTDLMIIEDAQDTKRMTWANVVKPIKDLIGNLASLTTNHKTSVVGAINEIEMQAQNSKDLIGNLASLTTNHKTSVVGAINEIKANSSLVAVSERKYGDGTNPYLQFLLDLPAGCTHAGSVHHWRGSDVLIPYYSMSTESGTVVSFYSMTGNAIPTNTYIDLVVYYRKL